MRGHTPSCGRHGEESSETDVLTQAKTPGAELAEALRLNPDLIEWSKQDSDLDSIRDDPAYQALYT